jgi:hypothetical protein
MAREVFLIEEGYGPQDRGDIFLTREEAEELDGDSLDPRESIVRYIPEDLDAKAALASTHARLERFAEKLSLCRLSAELYFEFAQIVKGAEGGLK